MDELEIVLEHLKKDASRDPLGYANEVFKPEKITSRNQS